MVMLLNLNSSCRFLRYNFYSYINNLDYTYVSSRPHATILIYCVSKMVFQRSS